MSISFRQIIRRRQSVKIYLKINTVANYDINCGLLIYISVKVRSISEDNTQKIWYICFRDYLQEKPQSQVSTSKFLSEIITYTYQQFIPTSVLLFQREFFPVNHKRSFVKGFSSFQYTFKITPAPQQSLQGGASKARPAQNDDNATKKKQKAKKKKRKRTK